MKRALKPGDRVRMTAEYKLMMRQPCNGRVHRDVQTGGECWACSTAHVTEFGRCIGVVECLTDYNNGQKARDPRKVGPEFDVRWIRSQLRYAYHPDHLERVPPRRRGRTR